MKVTTKLEKIKNEINDVCFQINRDPNEIKIIGVTKYVSVERAKEALEAGIHHLGENRDEGLLEKWESLKDKPTWHYIGSLQSRKVKNIIHIVDYIHSLDRLSLAEEINKRANEPIKCFVQVNVSGEESKHGLSPVEVLPFIEKMKDFGNVIIDGLMTMAPLTADEIVIRKCFNTLKKLQIQVSEKQWKHAPCQELSMGMSNDFKIAIEEGATMVRIGTALVGEEEV
ncbi:YggS family pyridoxal phosphate-dependent enzyme [Bacillus sp. CGMCC 1.16607]|uniref:YggS family pyridoxal phosphate-dependent enzyme n=1 Tax=Bacillus sp. CGMCC 1.16607 TaxID=3351842 RepID=UPI003634BC67